MLICTVHAVGSTSDRSVLRLKVIVLAAGVHRWESKSGSRETHSRDHEEEVEEVYERIGALDPDEERPYCSFPPSFSFIALTFCVFQCCEWFTSVCFDVQGNVELKTPPQGFPSNTTAAATTATTAA